MIKFLLRAAFWFTVVLIFLPIDRPDGESGLPVTSEEARNAAQSAFIDLASFCERNPETCQKGIETARLVGDRAQTGAIAVYRYFTAQPENPLDRPALDTLSADDRAPDWEGPADGV